MDDGNTRRGRDAPEQPVFRGAWQQQDGRAERQSAHVAPGDDVQDGLPGRENRLHVRGQWTRRDERSATTRNLDGALTKVSRTESLAQFRNSTGPAHARNP